MLDSDCLLSRQTQDKFMNFVNYFPNQQMQSTVHHYHHPAYNFNYTLDAAYPINHHNNMSNERPILEITNQSAKDCKSLPTLTLPKPDAQHNDSSHVTNNILDNEIKLGERAAIIPLTYKEKEIMERLDEGLKRAESLWSSSPVNKSHVNLMQRALNQWELSGANRDLQSQDGQSSWIWEAGRWNGNVSLPLTHELRLKYPKKCKQADHLVAATTCLKNRQQEKDKKAISAENSKEKDEEEPCLCQVRWGRAANSSAAKRRQKEKQDEEKWQEATHKFFAAQRELENSYAAQTASQYGRVLPNETQIPVPLAPKASGAPRPIIKTSHLYEGLGESVGPHSMSSGYASFACSPDSSKLSSVYRSNSPSFLCTDLLSDMRAS